MDGFILNHFKGHMVILHCGVPAIYFGVNFSNPKHTDGHSLLMFA